MNKVFSSKKSFFFTGFVLCLGLLGCGQKGALYLPGNEPIIKETGVIKPIKKKQEIKPVLRVIKSLDVVGDAIQINSNSAMSWNLVLTDNASNTNNSEKVRYILLKSDILSEQTKYSLIVGVVANKNSNKKRYKIKPDSYLRFRNIEKGYDKIPNLISRINSYFETNTTYHRLADGDFMVDDNESIDIYIRVRGL